LSFAVITELPRTLAPRADTTTEPIGAPLLPRGMTVTDACRLALRLTFTVVRLGSTFSALCAFRCGESQSGRLAVCCVRQGISEAGTLGSSCGGPWAARGIRKTAQARRSDRASSPPLVRAVALPSALRLSKSP